MRNFIYHFFSRQTALESSASISTILILMRNRVIRAYHYSAVTGHGKATIPKVALESLRGSLTLFPKVVACKLRGSLLPQTYLSALFNCQRTVGLLSACKNSLLAMGFYSMIISQQSRERGRSQIMLRYAITIIVFRNHKSSS